MNPKSICIPRYSANSWVSCAKYIRTYCWPPYSVEILGEADPSEILLVDKARRSARRLRDIEGVQQALDNIGSIQNLTLTELARNRRLLFVEGSSDYKILRRFAKILGHPEFAAGSGLTALESGGFGSWDRIRGLSWGLKTAMSSELKIATVFDRDFRSDDENQSSCCRDGK